MAFSFHQLPPEILHCLFRYLDILDILRIRRVSRHLNRVSHCRDVWSDAYRRAEFVRPPGPFLSQSAHELETALVPSFRVNQNLHQSGGDTAPKERPTLKLREIRYTGVDLRVSLVFGRFLFIAFIGEVRCYDLNLDAFDCNSGASIIYRSTTGALKSFHCASAVNAEGRPFACAVLSEAMGTTTQISIYSLDVGEDSDVTLGLLHQSECAFDVDTVDLGPRVIVIHCRGPAFDDDWHLIVLDAHTRAQFLLPSFRHKTEWDGTAKLPDWRAIEECTSPTSISTSTHLILAGSFYTQADGWITLLQAFVLPPPSTHCSFAPSSVLLSPSHCGVIPGINARDAVLLHDAVLDPITRDILIAIRVYAYEPSRPRSSLSKYGILRLSNAPTSSNAGHPEVGAVAFQLLGSLGQLSRTPFLHPSFNGAGRVFYTLEPGSHGIVSSLEYDLCRNAVEDAEASPGKVIEYPCILRFPTPRTLLDYDSYSGRICLRSAMGRYNVIEILDLAV